VGEKSPDGTDQIPVSWQGVSGREGPAIACSAACVVLGACTDAPAQDQIQAGEQIYEEYWANCHGLKLRRTGAIPDLKEQKADGRVRFDQMVMAGRGQMPAWQGIIGSDELDQLWAYVRSRAYDR
jgi:mono/diheme cytochrome c family protein